MASRRCFVIKKILITAKIQIQSESLLLPKQADFEQKNWTTTLLQIFVI
uniref:Uncharacterized protein n=1 Tax=Photobacterium damselae subsp. damselae TaxID=85581 RepID=E4WLK3_PHODD|nr:hypothetical protein [Photobacterium damselae subsp. damselae]